MYPVSFLVFDFLFDHIFLFIARLILGVLSIRISSDFYADPDVFDFDVPKDPAPCSFVDTEEPEQQPPFDALPDECLSEVLRRLSGARERSACASVSKHWLMLLSTIRKSELLLSTTNQSVETQIYVKGLGGRSASDVGLAAIAVGTSSHGGLGKLFIRGSASTRKLTNFGLKAISRGCPGLQVLSLWNLPSIGDESMHEIASGCRYLENIELSHCPTITDEGLIAIAMNCPALTSVTMGWCSNVGDEFLKALGLYCSNLDCITIRNCPLVGDKGIEYLFSMAGHILTKAKLEALSISNVSLAVIGNYGSAMKNLSLVGLQNVNENGFWVMCTGQGLKRLRTLSISACQGVSDKGIEALAKCCPNLKLFVLKKCPLVSDCGLVSIAKGAELLESLRLEECNGITQRGVFHILANCCKKLKALVLEKCLGVQDSYFLGLQSASLCLSLRSVAVRQCPGFGNAGLGLLGRFCPKLTHVDLIGLIGITDAGILPFCSKAGLVKLNVTDCVNLTNNAVSTIARFNGESLDVLILDGCGCITDVSLVAIAKNCTAITELDVSRCGITDSGISALSAAKNMNLQVLSLRGCALVSAKSVPFLVELGENLLGLNVKDCQGLSSRTIKIAL